jgi:hypothetical protein
MAASLKPGSEFRWLLEEICQDPSKYLDNNRAAGNFPAITTSKLGWWLSNMDRMPVPRDANDA